MHYTVQRINNQTDFMQHNNFLKIKSHIEENSEKRKALSRCSTINRESFLNVQCKLNN